MGMKEIFSLSRARRAILKNSYPKLNRPPAPIPTRWGTWLEAVLYYADPDTRMKILVVLEKCIKKEEKKDGQEGNFLFIVFA